MPHKSKSNWLFGTEATTPLNQNLIRQQFRKIIASSEFHATSRQRDFLTFVIMETLAGRSDNLRGYTVATKVLGRPEDFDGTVDPIVSIHANKLRRALERYYLVEGKFDPIRIDIPKGGYVPTFVRQDIVGIRTTPGFLVEEPVYENSWPTILILPFKNLTGEPEQNFLCSGISTELAIEVSRIENIQVLYPRDGIPNSGIVNYPRFILNGDLYDERSSIKLALTLVDAKSGIQIWGDIRKTTDNLEELYKFKEQVALDVATRVCGEFGIITRTISKETKNKPPDKLSTYEAILRFWEYEQNTTPESFDRAFEALKHATKLEPDCCVTLGCLAILYATVYGLDIPGFENPLEKSSQYAAKAAILNPDNQRNLSILAYVQLMSNELTTALHKAYQALELNPESLFFLDGLAWILTLSGDWEHGPRLAQKAINLNPFHRAVAHDALWLNYLRQEKYDLAYKESCYRQHSNLFWDPLMKASSLGLAGHKEEAKKWGEKLLELRPDFPEKGKWLIGNYIKFKEVSDRVVKGLRMGGVELK